MFAVAYKNIRQNIEGWEYDPFVSITRCSKLSMNNEELERPLKSDFLKIWNKLFSRKVVQDYE